MGSGDNAIILKEGADFSVRAVQGNVDVDIAGIATLGGDVDLGVFEADNPDDLGLAQNRTLSEYKGLTTIQESGTLRDGQAWSLSRRSKHQVDGQLVLSFNQEIGELMSSPKQGQVILNNEAKLYFGRLNQDVDYYGTSSGSGSLYKHGRGTSTIHGTLEHTGRTDVRVGTLLLGPEAVLSKESKLIANDPSRQPTIDLGSTTQDVNSDSLHGGVLRNGNLSTGNTITVSKHTNTIEDIDGLRFV